MGGGNDQSGRLGGGVTRGNEYCMFVICYAVIFTPWPYARPPALVVCTRVCGDVWCVGPNHRLDPSFTAVDLSRSFLTLTPRDLISMHPPVSVDAICTSLFISWLCGFMALFFLSELGPSLGFRGIFVVWCGWHFFLVCYRIMAITINYTTNAAVIRP